MDKTGKILLKAAELIEQRGWCQGHWIDARGHMCAEGAVRCAGRGDPNVPSKEATRALMRLDRALGGGYAAAWNDIYGRTKEEVIDALVAAAYWEE